MIELKTWLENPPVDGRPWLVLGKGPTFGRRAEFPLDDYQLLSLNHVVRELPVTIAHMIDIDVAAACGDALTKNCRFLVMPRYPHVDHRADVSRPLESFFDTVPALRALDEQGRLVWYNLRNNKKSPLVGNDSILSARYFSSEAALELLGVLGAKRVRSLGIDGGHNYGAAFRDLAGTTRLANGQPSFDLQFGELDRIVEQYGIDYAPLIPPMRVFVGVDETQMVPTRVLEYSIRKHTPMPVRVTPMLNVPVPIPKEPRNRPRTGFSFCRFLIPSLCGHRGRALYVDSDMQVFTDLEELWRIPFGDRKVLCTYQKEPPQAWRNTQVNFKPGRQMSVMMLDCERLPWRIEDIVRGLDDGAYTYEQLMFDLCLVRPDEIGDDLPPEWNCLEHYEPESSKLLHYTVVDTQPWRNDRNPLGEVWMDCYREAVAAGAVPFDEVADGVARGWLKPALLDAFPQRLRTNGTDAAPAGSGPSSPTVLRPQPSGWAQRVRSALRGWFRNRDVATRR
jgi:hypothetical protein